MKSVYDFPSLEDRLCREAEHYRGRHSCKKQAATLLVSTENLRTAQEEVPAIDDMCVTDENKFQIALTARGVNALLALYWLIKHHSYSAAYGRIRYLYEGYLVLSELNRNRSEAADRWTIMRDDLEGRESGWLEEYEKLTDVDYLRGLRSFKKGNVEKEYEFFDKIYDIASNIGTHPHTVRSLYNDGRYDSETHSFLLKLGLWYVFGFAAQYLRAFEHTHIHLDARRIIDPIFVDIRLALDEGLPANMEYELKLFAPETVRLLQ